MTETTQLPELNLEIVNKQVADGLARAEEVMKKTAELKEMSLTVKISDANDKVGYLATKEFLSVVRPLRCGLENERKACVKPFNELLDAVNAKYKAATSALAAIELPHKQEKEEYEAAIEQKKLDEAAAQEKIITDKINLLIKNGLEYNPNNGMYELDFNGKMVSVGRMDVINMQPERFEQLIERASGIKEEKESAEAEALRAKQVLEQRKNSIALLGMNFVGLDGYKITELETGGEIMISQEELSKIGDNDFVTLYEKISILSQNNKIYTASLKEAADKLARDKADLQAQQEKLKRDKITALQNRLMLHGYKFIYADPLEKSSFVFKNEQGTLEVIVSDILDNETEILQAIKESENLVTKQKEALAQIEDNKKKREVLEASQALKEKADKEKKEAAKKVDSKKDLALIAPHIIEITESMDAIRECKFKVIDSYADTLVSEMLVVLEKFQNSVKHLSS